MGSSFGGLCEADELDLTDLRGDVIAIDGHIQMHQFLHSITDSWGDYVRNSDGEPISHLIGFISRMAPTLDTGILPIVVFDGGYPDLKQETIDKRRDEDAVEQFYDAKRSGDRSKAHKYAHKKVAVTDDMLDSAEEVLDAMGIPVIRAPGEGEPQCAQLVHEGVADHVVSEDWDTLLYEPPTMLKSYTSSGCERVTLASVLDDLGWSAEELRWYGILRGTDYNSSPNGVGTVRGKNIIDEADSFQAVIDEALSWDDSIDPERWRKVQDLIADPDVHTDADVAWSRMDAENVQYVACDKHGIGRRQVKNYLSGIDTSVLSEAEVNP